MAWAAVYLLLMAYERGKAGGSVDWSEVDAAHSAALEARRLAEKATET